MAEFEITVLRSDVWRETFVLDVDEGEDSIPPTFLDVMADISSGMYHDRMFDVHRISHVVQIESITPADDEDYELDDEDGEPNED